MNLLSEVEKEFQKKELPDVRSGDEVALHLKVVEGGKERLQVFRGIVLAFGGRGNSKKITVRKVSYGEGVERTVPLNSPTLSRVEVIKKAARSRRAKQYYRREKLA